MKMTLRELKVGKTAKVVSFEGGSNMQSRLTSLGIRPGKEIKKVSSLSRLGPVTIKAGHSVVAIGRGMLDRIIVEEVE